LSVETRAFIPLTENGLEKKLLSFWVKTIKGYLKGFFFYGFYEGLKSQNRQLDQFFCFCFFGKFIGFPGLFNYYHLRFLPYYYGQLNSWKRMILREKDFFDHISD